MTFIQPDPVAIVWTNTGVNTNVTPDTDSEVLVKNADTIVIQIDSTNANNTSDDFDVNVHAEVNKVWTTVPYAEKNVGDAEIKTLNVSPGVERIRLRGDNNDAATTGYVTATVMIRERRNR